MSDVKEHHAQPHIVHHLSKRIDAEGGDTLRMRSTLARDTTCGGSFRTLFANFLFSSPKISCSIGRANLRGSMRMMSCISAKTNMAAEGRVELSAPWIRESGTRQTVGQVNVTRLRSTSLAHVHMVLFTAVPSTYIPYIHVAKY